MISPAGCSCDTGPTLCPAHKDMASISPSESAPELFNWCYERMAYYKAPGWVLFVDSLPTTGTQKVQKAQIFPAGTDARREPGAIDLRPLKKRS